MRVAKARMAIASGQYEALCAGRHIIPTPTPTPTPTLTLRSTGLCDLAEVVLQVGAGHADAVVLDGERVRLLVGHEAHPPLVERRALLREREEALLVARVRGVRDQLAKEDVLRRRREGGGGAGGRERGMCAARGGDGGGGSVWSGGDDLAAAAMAAVRCGRLRRSAGWRTTGGWVRAAAPCPSTAS